MSNSWIKHKHEVSAETQIDEKRKQTETERTKQWAERVEKGE